MSHFDTMLLFMTGVLQAWTAREIRLIKEIQQRKEADDGPRSDAPQSITRRAA